MVDGRSPPRRALSSFQAKKDLRPQLAPAHRLVLAPVPQEGRALTRNGSACTWSGAIPMSAAAALR